MFSMTCESCTAKLKVKNPALINQVLACPKCGSMIKIVAPTGQLPDAELSPQSTQTPVVSQAPGNIGDTDFAEIEKLIQEHENVERPAPVTHSPDVKRRAPSPKVSGPVRSGNSIAPSVRQAAIAKSGSDAKPPVPDRKDLRSPELEPPPFTRNSTWVSEAARRRQRILIILVSCIGLIALLATVGYLLWTSQSPLASRSTPRGQEQPDQQDRKDSPVDNTSSDTHENPVSAAPLPDNQTVPGNNVASPPSNGAQLPQTIDSQSNSKVSEAISLPPSLPGNDMPPPLPESPAETSEAPVTSESATRSPTEDEKKKASPLGSSRLLERGLDNMAVAPNPIADPKLPFELLEKSDLKALFQQSGVTLNEVGDAANREALVATVESPRFFIGRVESSRKKSTEEILGSAIPRIEYSGVSLRQVLKDFELLANFPIAVDPEMVASGGIDLARQTDFQSNGPDFRAAFDQLATLLDLQAQPTDWGMNLISKTKSEPVERVLELPQGADWGPADTTDLLTGIRQMIAPDQWDREPFFLQVESDKVKVRHLPQVVSQVDRLLTSIRAARSSRNSPSDQWPKELVTKSNLFQPNLDKKLDWSLAETLSLSDLGLMLQKQHGIELLFDWSTLVQEGWNQQTVLPLYFRPETVGECLSELCKSMHVSCEYLNAQTVLVKTWPAVSATRDIELYPIWDLTGAGTKPETIVELLNQTVGRNVVNDAKSPITCTYYEKTGTVVIVAPQVIQRQVEAVLTRLRKR